MTTTRTSRTTQTTYQTSITAQTRPKIVTPNNPQTGIVAAWTRTISQIPAPQAGCFVATYPSTVWQSTQCVTAPLLPLQPYTGGPKPATVGGGNDEVAYSSTTLIGSSVGSFQVNGLISESDSIYGADNYGLQINSQFFTTNTTYTGSKLTTGWEQFVWINWPHNNSVGYEYIQYWLIGYHTTYGSCPSTGPLGGTSWYVYSGSCYANSAGVSTPLEAATNLASLSLKGFSNYNQAGNDVSMFCVSTTCYDVTITDHIVNLYQNWHDSEFNVFGVGSGSQANFNSGTSIAVSNSLRDQNGNVILPSCANAGYTAETNNLNLGSCSNGITFIESNALSTPYVITDKSTYAQGDSISYSGSGFTASGSIKACLSTDNDGSLQCVSEPNADQNGFVAGTLYVGTNIPPGQQKFYAEDLTTSNLSNAVQLTIIQYAVCTYVNPNSIGATFLLGGNPYSDGQLAPIIINGTAYSLKAQVPPGYSFGVWMVSRTVTVTNPSSPNTTVAFGSGGWDGFCVGNLIVNYYPQIVITSSPAGSGFVQVDGAPQTTPVTFAWQPGSIHTVSASSQLSCGAGCEVDWVSWSDGGAQSHTITVPSVPASYSASFKTQYQLTLNLNGRGASTPSSGGWYDSGSNVQVTISSDLSSNSSNTRYVYNGATGSGSFTGSINPYTVTMNAPITESIAWQTQYPLTMTVSPSGGGSTTPSSGWQNASSTVTIQALANPGYSFVDWVGSGLGSFSGPGDSPSITMNEPIEEIANFIASTSISLTVSPASVPVGTPVTLSGSVTPSPSSVQVTLSISRDSGATWSSILSLLTDGTGSYSTSWNPPYSGSYLLKASWVGTNQFAGSTSTPTSLTVTGASTPTPTLLLRSPATASRSQSVRMQITVFNPTSTPLNAYVTVQIIGPGNYVVFDVVQVKVAANSESTGYYDWTVPNSAGVFSVTVGLLPTEPTAFDSSTIQVS